jgi:hypothetical protein
MTTETAAPAATATSTAILASDFSDKVTDVNRHTWTLGKMRYVIAALDGDPVAIIADNQTGFALVGARLIEAFDGGPSRGPRVTIETTYVDEQGVTKTQRTNYWLRGIGATIIPLANPQGPGGGAKWRAIEAARKDASAATAIARKLHEVSTGREWGQWRGSVDTAVPGTSVQVTYKPLTGNDYFADKWGKSGYWTIDITGGDPA